MVNEGLLQRRSKVKGILEDGKIQEQTLDQSGFHHSSQPRSPDFSPLHLSLA